MSDGTDGYTNQLIAENADLRVALAQLREEHTRLQQEYEKLRGARRIHELDNHHNAAACPYCRPTLEQQAADFGFVIRQRDDSQSTVAKLREALETYGRHQDHCRRGQTVAPDGLYIWNPESSDPKFGCTCGFDEAVLQGRDSPKETP